MSNKIRSRGRRGGQKNGVVIFSRESAQGNYLEKLLENVRRVADHIPPGSIAVMNVYHDEDCAMLDGTGPCDCKPTMQVKREDKP